MVGNPFAVSHAVSRPLPQPMSTVGPELKNRLTNAWRSVGVGWVCQSSANASAARSYAASVWTSIQGNPFPEDERCKIQCWATCGPVLVDRTAYWAAVHGQAPEWPRHPSQAGQPKLSYLDLERVHEVPQQCYTTEVAQ